jgi:hypothetical protein
MQSKKIDGPKNIPMIKFVGVSFESTNYKIGQDELNESISQGFRIDREYQTSSGVVFSLSKNMNNHECDSEQKLMNDYCVGSMAGDSQK